MTSVLIILTFLAKHTHIQGAPTPFPTTALYARVASDTYLIGATTVPMVTGRRQLAPQPRNAAANYKETAEELWGHRALAASPVDACYEACYSFYSPAPNNAQFFFQLLTLNGVRVCQCCKSCGPPAAQEGALLMEACAPPTAVRLTPSINRKFVKPNTTKPVQLKYKLKVRGAATSLELKNMGLQITVPAGATITTYSPQPSSSLTWGQAKTQTTANVTGNVISWYPLALSGTKKRVFRVRLTVRPPFGGAGASELRFKAELFQDAYNLAPGPYCRVPAADVVVPIKVPWGQGRA